MLNRKRLKNLSLLKNKELLNQQKEISTLDEEHRRNRTNKKKLSDILENTKINHTELAANIREKSQYKLRLIEQIYISDNREKFLNVEIVRAKKNLSKLIKEKDLVDLKIKSLTQLEKIDQENKLINSMPPKRNN